MKTAMLIDALKLCRNSLGTDFIPVLSHFCFVGTHIYAYNDVCAVVVDCETGIEAAVKGDALLGVLGTLREDVELSMTDTGFRITSGKATVDLAALPDSAFLFNPPDEKTLFSFVLTKSLLAGLDTCCKTVWDNAMKRELGAVLVVVENGVTVYSTDNVRLSRFRDKKKGTGEGAALIPADSLRQLVDLMKDGPEGATINFTKHWVHADLDGIDWYSKLFPESAPDYPGMFASGEPKAGWQKLPGGFIPSLKRAALLTSKDARQAVHLSVGGDELGVGVATGAKLGTFEEQMTLEKGIAGKAFAVSIEASKIAEAADWAGEFTLSPTCVGFRNGDYTCLVSVLSTKE